MPLKNASEILEKNIKRYYLLTGEDFLIKEFTSGLIEKVFKGEPDPSSITSYDLASKEDKYDINSIISEAGTMPMFSACKVVTIRNVNKLADEDAEKLMSFVSSLPDGLYVLLTAAGPLKKDKRKKKQSALLDIPAGNKADFSAGPDEIREWVLEFLKNEKKEMDYDVLEYMINESNGDLETIKGEIDKIMLLIGGKKNIEKVDFRKIRSGSKNYDALDLADAVVAGNREKAFLILECIYQNEAPEAILGLLFSKIKKIYTVIYFVNTKQEQKALKYVGKALFYIKKETGRFSKVAYVDILNVIKEADRKIKLSSRDKAKTILFMMFERIFALMKV